MRQKNQTRYLKAVPRQRQHSQSIWCSLQQQDGSKGNAVNIRNHYWNEGQLQDFGSKTKQNKQQDTKPRLPPHHSRSEGVSFAPVIPLQPQVLPWAAGSAFMVLPALGWAKPSGLAEFFRNGGFNGSPFKFGRVEVNQCCWSAVFLKAWEREVVHWSFGPCPVPKSGLLMRVHVGCAFCTGRCRPGESRKTGK